MRASTLTLFVILPVAIAIAGCGGGGGGGGGRQTSSQSVPVDPRSLAIADFDGDGRLDVVAANYNGNVVSVLQNVSLPGATSVSFAATIDFPVQSPQPVVVADLNGDGKPDFIVATPASSTALIYLNTTAAPGDAPSFASPASPTAISFGSTVIGFPSICVADFNGDGKLDIALNDLAVSVALNDTPTGASTVSFTAAVEVLPEPAPAIFNGFALLLAVDVDGDGKPDLVLSRTIPGVAVDAGGIAVCRNTTPQGSMVPTFDPPIFLTHAIADAMTLADLDGDGRPDLIASVTEAVLLDPQTIGGGRSHTVIFQNESVPGTITFTAVLDFDGVDAFALATGDTNLDGRPDLAIPDFDDETKLYINTTPPGGAISFAAPITLAVRPTSSTPSWGIAIADLTGSGRPQVIVTSEYPEAIEIYSPP